MQVLLNSNHSVTGTEELTRRVESVVHGAIGRFGDQVTRVEVHLYDENSRKAGEADKRCLMEARLGGLKPIAVTHHAPSFDEAIDGAADKLERALDHALGRLAETPGRAPSDDEIVSVHDLDRLQRDGARE